ncbi:protein sidekick-1-like [Haliotis asinina]|uniref:protein sidekick-1-like n=1 Tax=Haliotis asinina TaxID=109174 RepID=UPI0035324740
MAHLWLLLICLSPHLTACAQELVLDPPGPRLRKSGRPSSVACFVRGIQDPQQATVEWVDPDGEVIEFFDRRLVISDIYHVLVFREHWGDDVKDTGNYTCSAIIAGKIVKKTIWVDFSDDPVVGIYPSKNNSISRIEGSGKLILTCKAVGYSASDTKLEWLDPNYRTIGRYQTTSRIHTEQLHLRTRLQFDDVRVEDHGLYTCRVITGGLTMLKQVQVNVYGIYIFPSQNPLKVQKQTGISLHCQVTKPSGAKNVSVSWMHSYSIQVSSYDPRKTNRIFSRKSFMGSTMYIDDLTNGDNATHTCQIWIDGNSLHRDINLEFYDPPEIVITPAEDSIRRMKDTTTSIYCKSKGLSETQTQNAKFEWVDKHDNVIGPYIQDGPTRSRVYAMELPDGSRLQLDQLTSRERGTYTCRCTVGGNIMISEIELIVYGTPEAPTNLQAAAVDTNSITITWDKGYNGDTKQRFNIEYRQHDGQWTTHPTMPRDHHIPELTLGGLKPATVYEIRINAVNKYGSSSYTSVSVTTV